MTIVKGGTRGRDLGTRASFADVGATLAEFFDVEWAIGQSFLPDLLAS